jgi:hypothetical protein
MRPLLLLIILVGFALRLWQLDSQSLWSDEGLTLYRLGLSFGDLLRNTIVVDGIVTRDTNPPLFFLLLNAAQRLVGPHIPALRVVAVLLALPAIPLLAVTGRHLHSRAAGLIAAFLLAISPFHIWESQIVRNYGLLISLTLLCFYAVLRLADSGGRRRAMWAALWLSAGVAGSATHYFGFFVLAASVLALLAAALVRPVRRRVLRRLWLPALLLLPLLPLLRMAQERFVAGPQIDFYPVPVLHVVTHALHAFALGISPVLLHPAWRVWPVVGLAVAGMGVAWRYRPISGLTLLIWQTVPLGLLLLLSLINPLYNGTRHLLIGLPPFLLLVAIALAGSAGRHWLRHLAAALLLALLTASQLHHLQRQFYDPAFVRDDVRGVATWLNRVARPDDVIVLHDTLLRFTFEAYYHGTAPVEALPAFGERDPDVTIARLAALGEHAERVWFVTAPAPRTGFDRTLLTEWAESHWERIHDQPFAWLWLPVHLSGYLTGRTLSALPAEGTPQSADLSHGLRLHGHTFDPYLQPGEVWWVTLWLEAAQSAAGPLSLQLHLIAPDGTVAARAGQEIAPPTPGDGQPRLIRRDLRLTARPALPPGDYRLELAVPDGSQVVPLGPVTVLPTPCDQALTPFPEITPLTRRLHPIASLRGYAMVGEATYRPGHLADMTLFWCLERPVAGEDVTVQVALVDEAGREIDRSGQPLGQGGATLAVGTLLASRATLLIPATAQGEYRLRVSLDAPAGGIWRGGGKSADLAAAAVMPWPLETDPPADGIPVGGSWGTPPLWTLHSYTRGDPRVGEIWPLTLYWIGRSDSITENWFLFLHLTNQAGEIVAQSDGPPVNGVRLTTSWRNGELIRDERALWLPPDLPPGDYTLYAGWYHPDTGQRVPLADGGERLPVTMLQLAGE